MVEEYRICGVLAVLNLRFLVETLRKVTHSMRVKPAFSDDL